MEELLAPPPVHHHKRTIQDNIRILLKRRWAFFAVFISILATAAVYSFTATPIYRATVRILIERHTPRLLEMREAAPVYDSGYEEFYQTQYKLLENEALVKKVVEKLQLENQPRFAPMFKGLQANADKSVKQKAEERLINAIQGGIEVSPIRQSSLVDLSFSDPDPGFAAGLINALAQSYIEYSLDLRFAASQEASNWLKLKVAEARKKLEDSETKLNQYKREQNIFALEDKENITAQKLEQLNKELISAQTHRMETETRFKEVNQGKPIPQVLNNALIQTLKGQEAKLIAEQSELSKKYGEGHPRMMRLHNELGATRGKISAETAQIVQSIKNEYHMAKAQEGNLKSALDAQKEDTQDFSDRAIQYRVLLRDVETNRALYENVLKSLKTTTATENLPATNIRIVYPAMVPEFPVSPRKFRNLLFGAILGIILGATVVLGLENLDTTLKTPEDVEGWLETPNLGMVPHLELSAGNPGKETAPELPELVVHHGTQPLASEAYRGLRTSILFSSPGQAPKLLLVTSSLPEEGKTLTAINLACAMAKAEPGILLVDSDLRRPNLHKIFRIPQEPGLSNFLVGEINEIPAIPTIAPNLFVVPSGHIPPNPSELLGSEAMARFLAQAQEQFGRVILDSPPLMSVTDPAILASLAKGVLLVVKAESVPRKVAIEARNQLQEVKAHLLGVILNDVPTQGNGYYYSHYRYSSYYTSEDGNHTTRHRTSGKKSSAPGFLTRLTNQLTNFKRKYF
jgi:capsular exopolysaccharide synthesis family protein